MKINLSPEVERLIEEKVGNGRYRSADEVVREGLQLLQQRDDSAMPQPSKHAGNLAELFESIAKDVPEKDWENVPADLSKNLDHYLYGRQKTT
jgi:putative addiction module CopG family antidote